MVFPDNLQTYYKNRTFNLPLIVDIFCFVKSLKQFSHSMKIKNVKKYWLFQTIFFLMQYNGRNYVITIKNLLRNIPFHGSKIYLNGIFLKKSLSPRLIVKKIPNKLLI